ncbi:MAG: UDP-N-acetylmuramoyl-L-alanine--D-glutamate ligase [Betaproteobacteria bacterium]|nr:UDP-N-acetylmuramoyl-L-alanine--D-glutamate ligase [Betaproteobacteria bacterium]
MEIADKGVLVLGLGESGLAMARWLVRQGARVRVADSRAAPPCAAALRDLAAAAQLVAGTLREPLLDGMQVLAISPGLSQREPVVRAARERGIAVTGEMELFAAALRQVGGRERARLIAITGTNGKTTVTTLVGEMCRAAGLATAVAGNISPSALTALLDHLDAGTLPEAWVLELSSFQLETTATLAPDAAPVLNVSDDHLDRYDGLDDYCAAKARVFDGAGIAVLNRDDARVMAMARAGQRTLSFGLDAPPGPGHFGLRERDGAPWLAEGDQLLLSAADLPLAGRHNVANALAALALCRAVGLPAAPLVSALRGFRGLPHRVERVADVGGVAFYDDSKGTNVGATLAALQGLGRPVVLIAGGDGKGQDFRPLREAVARHARAVVLIGRDGPLIGAALAGCGVPLESAADMDRAVARAFACAQPGDAVLLSPACASFDMFRDYAHRAQVFVAAVRALAEAVAQP